MNRLHKPRIDGEGGSPRTRLRRDGKKDRKEIATRSPRARASGPGPGPGPRTPGRGPGPGPGPQARRTPSPKPRPPGLGSPRDPKKWWLNRCAFRTIAHIVKLNRLTSTQLYRGRRLTWVAGTSSLVTIQKVFKNAHAGQNARIAVLIESDVLASNRNSGRMVPVRRLQCQEIARGLKKTC